jgi:hypothetical protein
VALGWPRERVELITRLEILNAQNNLPPFGKKLSRAANRAELYIPQRFTDRSVQLSATLDLALIDKLDEPIAQVELHLTRTARVDDVQTYRVRCTVHARPAVARLRRTWARTCCTVFAVAPAAPCCTCGPH